MNLHIAAIAALIIVAGSTQARTLAPVQAQPSDARAPRVAVGTPLAAIPAMPAITLPAMPAITLPATSQITMPQNFQKFAPVATHPKHGWTPAGPVFGFNGRVDPPGTHFPPLPPPNPPINVPPPHCGAAPC